MATLFATPNTLLGSVKPRGRAAELGYGLVVALLGSALLTVSARLNIPFIPVPATFQTMAVAVLAAAFGWRIGVATVALYILEGLSGLPVFAAGGGAAYLFSPTFGFIAGWLAMAAIVGAAADAGASKRILPLFGAMLLGDAVAFGTGYAWLIAMSGGAAWIDHANLFGSAFDIAVKPFIVWDILKMGFAALTIAGGWQLLKSRR